MCVVGEGGLQNITAHQVPRDASSTRALSTFEPAPQDFLPSIVQLNVSIANEMSTVPGTCRADH